jgi:hypothetical protein
MSDQPLTEVFLAKQRPAYVTESPEEVNQAREQAMTVAKQFVELHDENGDKLYLEVAAITRMQKVVSRSGPAVGGTGRRSILDEPM